MGKSNKQYKQLKSTDSQDMTNFGTVLFYCLLIILLPIAAFFTSKSFVFDGILKLESVKSNIYSACVAVFALHIALGLYIWRAYSSNKSLKEIQEKIE